jgi:predicted nucleic acid-binding protein
VTLEYKNPYLDSSVYIAAINGEADRADIVKQILAAADRSEIQIVASTFVAAEVIKMKGETETRSSASEAKIDAILRSDKIRWVELDLLLATDSRKIARDYSLKPPDAIHLASAIRGKADVLLRYDDRFTADGKLVGLEVCEPYWYGAVPLFGDPS